MEKRKIIIWAGLTLVLFAVFSNSYGKERSLTKTLSKTPIDSNKDTNYVMSPEEKLIRLAYKKLTVYNAVAKYREGKSLKEITESSNALRFKLSNFKSGAIEEIRNTLYNYISTPPTGEIIQLGRSTVQWNNRGEQIAYKAQWISGKYATGADRNWTIGDVLKIETAKYYDVKRYTSYEVTVSFEGKSRTYRALVLFHGTLENPRPEFWDSIVGMGGNLTFIWEEQRLPFGLNRRSDLQTNRMYDGEEFTTKIRKFLNDDKNILGTNESGISCPDNSTDLRQCCIDTELAEFWETNACGGWWIDLKAFVVKSDEDEMTDSDIPFYQQDNTGHPPYPGVHHGRARFRPECFAEPNNQQRCNVQIRDVGYGDSDDNTDWYWHVGNYAENGRGNSGPRGQDISCDSSVGFAFDRCLVRTCGVSLQLSVSGSGASASATVSGGNLWRAARAEGTTCRLQSEPSGECEYLCRSALAVINEDNKTTQSNQKSINSPDNINPCWICPNSPVLIDILGNGFAMTNLANGVFFDLNGDGRASRMSWTAADADEAFLALDRNTNGLIDSGLELFGDATAQPAPQQGEERNGFRALAEFDKPANGGNNDNQIDERDAVFAQLKLWSDRNHNGISEANELQNLSNSAVRIIELDYHESRRVDEHGNQSNIERRCETRKERKSIVGLGMCFCKYPAKENQIIKQRAAQWDNRAAFLFFPIALRFALDVIAHRFEMFFHFASVFAVAHF